LPTDIADLLADLGANEDIIAFQCLEPELAARTFEHLDRPTQEELLEVLPEPEQRRILNEIKPDDRTALLGGISRLLTLLTPENQRIARSPLSYGQGTVGRLMTPEFIGVKEAWTIGQVLDHVRQVGRDSETLNALYVTDAEHHLIDDIRMHAILLAQPA
jgi:magnesium transporter